MDGVIAHPSAIILAYHHVCYNWYPSISRVTPGKFQDQMELLVHSGAACPTLSEYFYKEATRRSGKPVILTFDDALNCFYEQSLPGLIEKGMRATVFVVTDFVGKGSHWDYYRGGKKCRHLDWHQLRRLVSLGIEVGSHSCTHADLLSCSPRTAEREIGYSKQQLEDRLGVPVRFFSYPFGRVNKTVENLCRKAGYVGAVSMYPGTTTGNPFRLNRNGVYLFEGRKQFGRKIGVPAYSDLERSKLRAINLFSMGTIILNNMKTR